MLREGMSPALRLVRWAEIRMLVRLGHPHSEIARLTGASRATIGRIAREPEPEGEGRAAYQVRGAGRPTKTEPFRHFVRDQLIQDPSQASLEIVRQAQARGYAGGKTAMYDLIARVRSEAMGALPERRELLGAISQHELGHVRIGFDSGGSARVSFLASRLYYSRWLDVSILADWAVEPLVRALVTHFARMGGVPLTAVLRVPRRMPLRTRTSAGYEWHPAFAQAALDLGLGVAVRYPGEKGGGGEALASSVKKRFFDGRRFRDALAIQPHLSAWLKDMNRRLPGERLEQERANLLRLPVQPDRFALRFPVVVGPNGDVRYEGFAYPAPPETAGMLGTLHVEPKRLHLTVGRRQMEYERQGIGAFRHDRNG